MVVFVNDATPAAAELLNATQPSGEAEKNV